MSEELVSRIKKWSIVQDKIGVAAETTPNSLYIIV